MMRKANAILEYGILIIIVIGALAGIQSYMERSITTRVKHESDATLQHGQGLEWEASITTSEAASDFDRYELPGARVIVQNVDTSSYTTYVPPVPPYVTEHKGDSLHIQDAAMAPPELDYPQHQRESDEDKAQPKD